MDKQSRFGTLVIVVDKARNLPNRKKIGKQDAYAIVRLGHEVQRTPTDKRAGQVPSWNHEIRFKVPNESENILKISIFNEDSKTPDLIADCAIDLTELYKKHEFDSWFDLKYKDKPAGEVYAELTFYYEGPPRPKPKIELKQDTGKAANHMLPRVLPAAPRFFNRQAPQRQMTLPCELPGSRRPLESLCNDVTNLSIQPLAGFCDRDLVSSPYQNGVQYADTWDGSGSTRVVRNAPGDVRRKSFSDNSHKPLVTTNRGSAENGFTYQSPSSLHQMSASVAPRRKSHADIRGSSAQDYRDQRLDHARSDYLVQHLSYRHSPTGPRPHAAFSPQPFGHSSNSDTDEVGQTEYQYAEPLLDPRHGSDHELHNSPQILSPNPEYPSNSRRSPVLSQNVLNPNPRSTSRDRDISKTGTTGQRSPINADEGRYVFQYTDCGGPDPSCRHAQHAQAKSLSSDKIMVSASHNSGPNHYQHYKAASASHLPSQHDRSSSASTMAFASAPHLVAESSGQRMSSYAATPAQYVRQMRPLPAPPSAPPALPAKIPLGLTREEYDILYGR